jgi:hypothetical protein
MSGSVIFDQPDRSAVRSHSNRNLRFGLENDTIVRPSRLIATLRNDFHRSTPGGPPSAPARRGRPSLRPVFAYPSSPGPPLGPISDADSTTLPLYPVGTGSSAIRASIAPNRLRFRCSRVGCKSSRSHSLIGTERAAMSTSRQRALGTDGLRRLPSALGARSGSAVRRQHASGRSCPRKVGAVGGPRRRPPSLIGRSQASGIIP